MITIIILAGGVGMRFGSSIPKQFITIDGRRIIDITVEKFISIGKFICEPMEIIVACHPSWNVTYDNVHVSIKVVNGADTRFDSFLKAYYHASTDCTKILVHDAVRPFISTDTIVSVINYLDAYDAVIPAIKPTSSTVIETPDGIRNVNRDRVNMTQTPEGFRVNKFREIFDPECALNSDRTSIFSLFVDNQQACAVHLIQGSETNIKITTKSDIDLAKILSEKSPPAREHRINMMIGRRALILGGTGGIGSKIVETMRAYGAIVDSVGSNIDLCDDSSLLRYYGINYDYIIHSVGTLSCGGRSVIKDFSETEVSEFRYCMDLMLVSAYNTAKLAVECMGNTGGKLIFIGSSASYSGRDKFALYATPKAGLNVFVESIAEEFKSKYDIHVNVINPSITDTKMVQHLSEYDRQKEKLSPATVAQRVLDYLLSNQYGQRHLIRVGDA